jgi:hypothetical protein
MTNEQQTQHTKKQWKGEFHPALPNRLSPNGAADPPPTRAFVGERVGRHDRASSPPWSLLSRRR